MNAAAVPPPASHPPHGGASAPAVPDACLELPAEPVAAAIARRHVAAILAGWGRPELTETAQLIVSELVANAVKAAGLGPPGTARHAAPRIWAGLYRAGERVVVEVWDPGRTPPRLLDPGPWDSGGRGLRLVGELADGWGYRWVATGGKVVWALCSAPPENSGP